MEIRRIPLLDEILQRSNAHCLEWHSQHLQAIGINHDSDDRERCHNRQFADTCPRHNIFALWIKDMPQYFSGNRPQQKYKPDGKPCMEIPPQTHNRGNEPQSVYFLTL